MSLFERSLSKFTVKERYECKVKNLEIRFRVRIGFRVRSRVRFRVSFKVRLRVWYRVYNFWLKIEGSKTFEGFKIFI